MAGRVGEHSDNARDLEAKLVRSFASPAFIHQNKIGLYVVRESECCGFAGVELLQGRISPSRGISNHQPCWQ